MTQLPPICRQVVVSGSRAAAFEVFTAGVAKWWPLAEHSVYGAGGSVSFTEGRLVERGPAGDEAVWGTVLDWEPPERLRLTWHPGYEATRASEVEVRFAEITGDLTLVTLIHRGWERFPDPARSRTSYNQGWPNVLRALTDHTPAALPSEVVGPVWLVLMYSAGPALPAGEPVSSQPDFAEHAAFLRRLDERGVLVAAGLLDGHANRMAVIRVPDPADVPSYVRLVEEDDQSVVRGLLVARVRPWNVAIEGAAIGASDRR